MSRSLSLLTFLIPVLAILLVLSYPRQLLANPLSENSTVTATVPSTGVTGDTVAPTSPILVRPVDGTVTADQVPEFSWKQSSEESGNTVIYTLYIDGVATFLGISNLGNSIGTGYSSRVESEQIKLLPTIPLNPGPHDWYVVASDLSGNASYSATWHFTIDTTPPSLTLLDLEDYHLPTLSSESIFDIQSPQNVDLTVATESYATVYVTIVDSSGISLTTLSLQTGSDGRADFSYPLSQGLYSVLINAVDRAGLTSTLPEFFLNLYVVTIPLPSLPPAIRPPLALPPSLILPPPLGPALPAVVSRLATRDKLSLIPYSLLAVIPFLLLILLKKKYNLRLVDSIGDPVPIATITHTPKGNNKLEKYELTRDDGWIYIPKLTKGSLLTISLRTHTFSLCLLHRRSHYLLIC